MRVGDSKWSKYGGVSELFGRLRSFSGEVAASDASLERNGSLWFSGGNGALILFLIRREQWVLTMVRRRVGDEEEAGEQQGIVEEAIDRPKLVDIGRAYERSLFQK